MQDGRTYLLWPRGTTKYRLEGHAGIEMAAIRRNISSAEQQVSLECANSKVPLSLIGLLKDRDVLVGAIDVASLDVETPEKVAATLAAAIEFVDPERTLPCTNCGLAPLSRDISARKIRALGAGAELAICRAASL